jgi:hypothetical protein
MSLELPDPVRRFFESDQAQDAAGLRAVLAPDIHVHDEARDYHGPDEVAAWRRDARAKYRYTSTPLAVRSEGDGTVVRARLDGNFPGSPVEVDYTFRLTGGQISGLTIG